MRRSARGFAVQLEEELPVLRRLLCIQLERCAAWQRDGGESAESAGVANLEEGGDNSKDEERLPSIIEYGLCRGTLGSEVVRLQVTRRVNSVWTRCESALWQLEASRQERLRLPRRL